MVPMVSLLQRFHCTELFTVVPRVSLLQRFHCAGLLTVVPMVSLLQRFHCTELITVVLMVSLLQRFHCTGQLTVVPMVSLFIEVSLHITTILMHQNYMEVMCVVVWMCFIFGQITHVTIVCQTIIQLYNVLPTWASSGTHN